MNTSPLKHDIVKLQTGLNDMRAFQSEQTSRIASLEADLRTLSGRVEELQYSQNTRLGGDLNTLKRNLSDLENRIPPPSTVPGAELEADQLYMQTLPVKEVKPLADALSSIRRGRFQEALTPLQESLDRSVGQEWGALVLFWSGITYENLGEKRKAVENYHSLVARYPKHSRAALALLKESGVLLSLGDKKLAKLTLNKLIAEHPKSKEAAAARERLKTIK
jgi:TolA-binding protein